MVLRVARVDGEEVDVAQIGAPRQLLLGDLPRQGGRGLERLLRELTPNAVLGADQLEVRLPAPLGQSDLDDLSLGETAPRGSIEEAGEHAITVFRPADALGWDEDLTDRLVPQRLDDPAPRRLLPEATEDDARAAPQDGEDPALPGLRIGDARLSPTARGVPTLRADLHEDQVSVMRVLDLSLGHEEVPPFLLVLVRRANEAEPTTVHRQGPDDPALSPGGEPATPLHVHREPRLLELPEDLLELRELPLPGAEQLPDLAGRPRLRALPAEEGPGGADELGPAFDVHSSPWRDSASRVRPRESGPRRTGLTREARLDGERGREGRTPTASCPIQLPSTPRGRPDGPLRTRRGARIRCSE